MNDSLKDLTFHTRFERPAHGCLPLFVVVMFVAVFAALWLVPVVPIKTVHPLRVGTVSERSDGLTSFMVLQQSPLPLLQPWDRDPDFDEQRRLPLTHTPRPMEAPPLPTVPRTYDSAVLQAEELLALPPDEAQPSKEEEVQP